MKKYNRLLSLAIGLSALGSASVICNAQDVVTGVVAGPANTFGQIPQNPGATGIERANNPSNKDAYESMGMRQARFGADQGAPSGYTSSPSTVTTAPTANSSSTSVAKVLDVSGTVSVIQSSNYKYRNEVGSYVVSHVASGDVALDTIVQQGSDRLTGETRAQALRHAQQTRSELIATLRDATAASPSDWDQARTQMAQGYQRYAAAVIHVENVATGRVASTVAIRPNGVLVASTR